jgi:hypothetical protein
MWLCQAGKTFKKQSETRTTMKQQQNNWANLKKHGTIGPPTCIFGYTREGRKPGVE